MGCGATERMLLSSIGMMRRPTNFRTMCGVHQKERSKLHSLNRLKIGKDRFKALQ